MKILDKIWFTMPHGETVGLIMGEDEVTGDRKAYIGVAAGVNEKLDAQYILNSGAKFHPLAAKAVMRHFEEEASAEEKELQAATDPTPPPDARIAYGARCTWWDSISRVGLRHINGHNLPCCPRCGGMLLEVESEDVWRKGIEVHAASGFPDYPQFMAWLRGKCFPSFDLARKDFELAGGGPWVK